MEENCLQFLTLKVRILPQDGGKFVETLRVNRYSTFLDLTAILKAQVDGLHGHLLFFRDRDHQQVGLVPSKAISTGISDRDSITVQEGPRFDDEKSTAVSSRRAMARGDKPGRGGIRVWPRSFFCTGLPGENSVPDIADEYFVDASPPQYVAQRNNPDQGNRDVSQFVASHTNSIYVSEQCVSLLSFFS